MKTTILFIQGGGKNAHEADQQLASYLKTHLGKDYTISFPKMPNEAEPDYETYKTKIDQELKEINAPIILSGHSLGAVFLLKYLTEEKTDKDIAGLFLIATPFWGKEGWQYAGFSIDNDHASKATSHIPTFFYQSTTDETVPPSHLDLYAEKFPHASIRKITRPGHQLENDLREVVEDIQNLSDKSLKH